MSIPDLINGSYEFLGGFAIWINVRGVIKDRGYSGIRVLSMIFFTTWGLWNLFYYPYLHQWISFIGGLNIAIANVMWILAALHYGRKV